MNTASVITTIPFDFKIVSQNQSDVLFITDNPNGETVNISVTNQTGNPVTYMSLAGAEATVNNHHFEIRFRPGILDVNSIGAINILNDGWSANASVSTLDGTVSVYVLKTLTGTLSVNEELSLQLGNIKVDGTRGSRSSNVEVNFKKLAVQDNEFSGRDLERVGIINQVGLVDMPLRFYFRYFNKVLNNNQPQKLELNLFNSSNQNEIKLTSKSQFIITFDKAGEPALHSNIMDIANVSITAEAENVVGKFRIQSPDSQDQNPQWIISVVEGEEVKVQNGENLCFNISNIKADQAGLTNMYVDYRNIPNYQDGMVILNIERTPIHISAGTADSADYVGIGINSPQEKLHISSGNLRVDGGEIKSVSSIKFRPDIDNNGDDAIVFQNSTGGENARIHTNGNVGIGTNSPNVKLEVRGDSSNANVQVLGTDATNATWRLATPSSGTVAFGGNSDHNVDLGYFSNDNSSFTTRLRVERNSGFVGIGTTDPEEKLHVLDGHIRVDNGEFQSHGQLILHPDVDESGDDVVIFKNSAGGENARIHSNGNLGLGTTGPAEKIHVVNGHIRVDGGEYRSHGPIVLRPDTDNTGDKDIKMYGRIFAFPSGESSLQVMVRSGVSAVNGGNVVKWSDERLKKDIQSLDQKSILDKINQLNPMTFKWNELGINQFTKDVENDYRSISGTEEDDQALWEEKKAEIRVECEKEQIGFIAQEVQAVDSEWVKEGEDGYMQLSMENITTHLVAAVKELTAKVTSLEAQLAAKE